MKKSAITRIVIWSLVIALLLGLLIAGLGYRNWRYRTSWNTVEAQPLALDTSGISTGTYTATEKVNVRESPSMLAANIGVLDQGETATVKRSEIVSGTNWAYISSPVEGWVVADYLESANAPDASAASVPADQVQQISIDWVSGTVTIQPGDVEEISFYEDNTNEKYPMVWKLRSGKLSIQFCQDNSFPSFNFTLTKNLTVLVPRDFILDELELDAASTNLYVSDLTIREVDLDTASGTCRFQNCDVTDLDIDTASGDVFFTGSLGTLDFDAASASFTGVLTNTPSRIDVDSASGDVDLTLPEDTGFTVKLDGLSCDFSSDFDTTSRNGSHIHGDGRCHIDMDGMSSGIIIRKSEVPSATVPTTPEASAAPEASTTPEAPPADTSSVATTAVPAGDHGLHHEDGWHE